jgi:hypothetical protein
MRFSRLNPRLALLAALLAALVVAGCGGGGDTSEATQAQKAEAPAKLSKAEFISQGDAICGEVNSAVGSIEASEAEVASSEQAAQVANLYTGMIERLTKLGAPAEMDGYSEFSEAAELLGKVESEVKAAAEKEELVALEEASNEAVPALESFQNAAAVYGFEACSEGPQAPTGATGAGAGVEEEIVPEEGGVEPEIEEEFVPEEEVAPEIEEEIVPEEEVAPETGGAGGVGEGGGEVEGGGEESSGGGIGAG